MEKEKIGQIVMWIIAILTVLGVSVTACDHIFHRYGIPHDSILEEAFEDVIEEKTGIEIDITKKSPE